MAAKQTNIFNVKNLKVDLIVDHLKSLGINPTEVENQSETCRWFKFDQDRSSVIFAVYFAKEEFNLEQFVILEKAVARFDDPKELESAFVKLSHDLVNYPYPLRAVTSPSDNGGHCLTLAYRNKLRYLCASELTYIMNFFKIFTFEFSDHETH